MNSLALYESTKRGTLPVIYMYFSHNSHTTPISLSAPPPQKQKQKETPTFSVNQTRLIQLKETSCQPNVQPQIW